MIIKPQSLVEMVMSLSEPRTVADHLFDWAATIQGSKLEELLSDVLSAEVDSFDDARRLVNLRIDNWINWLDGGRPVPSFIYELSDWERWCDERKWRKVWAE